MRRRVGLGVIADNWERNQLVTSRHFAPRSRLEIALLSFLCNVAGGADRDRHDGQGGIILRECRKAASRHNEQVFHIVCLAVGFSTDARGSVPMPAVPVWWLAKPTVAPSPVAIVAVTACIISADFLVHVFPPRVVRAPLGPTVTRLGPRAAKTPPRPCGIDQVFRRRGQQAIRDDLLDAGRAALLPSPIIEGISGRPPLRRFFLAWCQQSAKSIGVV